MNALVCLLIIAIVLFVGITWVLPKLIGYVLLRKFKVHIQFGRIGIPFSLKDVKILKNGFSLHIDEICIRSSFFNSEVTKLLSINIRDIRINKDINKKLTSDNIVHLHTITKGDKRVLDFRNKKIPPSIIKFVQFMAVHIHNISLVLMNNNFEPNWLLHATATELHLDGSIVHNTKSLIVTAALNDAQAKMLRQYPAAKMCNDKLKAKPCLAELSFGIALDAVLIADGQPSLEKIHLTMNNTKTIIHGGLYDFIRDAKSAQRDTNADIVFHEAPKFNSQDFYERISPIIPKNFLVKIESARVSAVKDNSSDDFAAKLKLLMINGNFDSKSVNDKYQLPTMYTGLQLQHLEIDTKHEKLLFVEQFTIDSKLEKDIINTYFKLKTFQLIYNHTEIYEWVKRNIFTYDPNHVKPLSLILPSKSIGNFNKNNDNISFVNWVMERIVVKGCAELWNISMLAKLNDETAALSCSHLKLILEQYDEKRNNVYGNRLVNVLLNNRHWSIELMIESLWWSLGNATSDTNFLKKIHTRGSPFFLGVSLIKLSSYGNATKLDLSVHTLRTEYSKCLAEFLLKLQECGRQYGIKKKSKVIEEKVIGDDGHASAGLLVNAKITDVTTFFFNNYEACMLISLTEVSLARTQQITVLKLSGFQTAILGTTNDQLMSLNDFTDIFGNIKVIRVEYGKHPKMPDVPQFNVYILKDTEAMWNSNVHMHIVTLLRDMLEFRDKFQPKSTELDFSPVAEKVKINKVRPIIDVYAEGTTVLGIKISDRHSMQIFLENFYFSYKERILISTEKIFINIDEMHIFTLKDVDVQSLDSIEVLKSERQNYEHFAQPSNKVWITTIGGFKGIFPYDHDFADAVQNEFVSLFKWLKLVHNVQKKPFTKNSPLPRDMIIQVKEFLLELSDDPFEVKLRDNYVLLVDEYHESLKRKQLFDHKIRELCSERLLLPTGTIEELYSNLVKKNSEIYIQRSKKINEAGPTRTRLFAWILTDLQIMAMADPSIHGKENVTNVMREIDADSPWPEEGLDFVTLWCRAVNISCSEWKFMLRDFPQPMFFVKEMRLFGNLCGAEQMAPARAKRDVSIEIGDPFGIHEIQRSMTSLKFYHDFDCEYDLCSYAFGPCWEPVMAQCNLSFEKISTPSKDPSPAMPFWDKMRLLFHGRLTMIAKQFTVLLHASLDPYNTTEEMELSWHNCGIVWTNAKVMFKGELNVCVRTASRYDDCRLLHFPNLKLTFKLNWICLANPNDHHAVIPCAPDKLPEYSSNQVHDSFRAFRSQNLNIWVSFETKPIPGQQQFEYDLPNLVLYGSTLRWFESLQLILSGVTRPTRRGPVFNNIRPRKKQLSRHYRKAHLQMSLHKFQVLYWMSHALHRGFELNGGRVTFSSEHTLTLHPIDDGLIHRQRADWYVVYMNCELNDAEIWLKSILNEKLDISSENIANPDSLKIVKFYFLSLAKVSYGREAMIQSSSNEPKQKDAPAHKLVVYDLKGAWTKNNRDVAFALFDSFMKSQKLKNNLSTEALKGFRKEGSLTPLKSRRPAETSTPVNPSSGQILGTGSTSSSITQKQQTSHAANMLQQLIAEADHKFNVYSDDLSTQTREAHLQGLQACQDEDVTQYNWFISLVNSQVLLKGCETSGYVILSAAKAEILQRVHRPVWRDRSLVSKTTWVGFLECMQYYATVSPDENDSLLDENIMWLTLDNIEEKDKDATVINELPDIPHLVGSGHSVGGVVSETVGATGVTGHPGEVHPIQLQRIVSRCKCEFFYVSYGDTTSIDPSSLTEVPPPPTEETLSPWEKQDEPVDAFTLMHHDLDVCTNSLQYAMILDIVNNLMLYVEPQRKQALEKLARMRFQLQFSGEDQKRPIQHLQTQVRSLMSRMRSLEKDIHLIGKARAEEGESEELKRELEEVQKQIKECKDLLTAQSEELDMMLSCYKETQLSAMNKLATIRKDRPITIVRANEICFKHAQWRLTEADGQIGIADLILSNFLYTKKSKNDDSVEHLLELGYIRMNNLIPRENYKEVLCPTEIQKDMPVDHQRVIRVFCREKPPVGGISVKEHFEINVVPITIAITKKFYSTMLKFCFPDRDPSDVADDIDDTASVSSSSSLKSTKKAPSKLKKANKDSEFYVRIEKDDVEKMKERAEKNKLFIYIKIPEVPVRVSYKGNKEKNFEDITDFSLVIPTLEYHNVTWTWLDLLLAMKSDSRRVILSQAIKQKLQIHRHKPLTSIGERSSPQEEDKAKMLFGNRQARGTNDKTDLCGIKWRKLVLGERPNASSDPLDDPVLRSYSRCLAVDILCVWRRVAAPKPEPDQPGNLFEISLSGTGNSGSVVHPPLSLTAAKELWIFWYGEEPDLTDLLAPELLKSSEGGQGSWESGITYECRSLLFKALHNLIERCLLSKDVVRLGRWFVQPCSNRECTFGKSSHHLSFSFAFFVHGESTVCASMDLRVHPAVRPLTPEYLAESGQTNNNETKPKPVILAPFGLTATLTGQSFRALDPVTQKAFDDWCSFYPLCNKENSNLPPMVEVLSGGVKMRYPSKYVLITDLDDENYDVKSAVIPPVPISEKAINDLGNAVTMHTLPPPSAQVPERAWQNCISSPFSLSTPIKEENCSTSETNAFWDFIDPTHKASCICAKCRKLCGRTTAPSMKQNSRPDKGNRTNRVPFHKRQPQHILSTIFATNGSSSSVHTNQSAKTTPSTHIANNPSCTTSPTTSTSTSNSIDSIVAPLSTASQRSTGGSTPQGGSLSFCRNPNSIPESLPAIPSVGSPGSAGPSPHPNSSLSQPTSVPPPDQLIPVISPIPPPSNNQPSTPIEHLDKNTPAATPTDPQESKSTTASPYVAPAPASVEPPPSANNNGNSASDQVKIKIEPNTQTNATANMNNSNSDGTSVSGIGANSSANANSGSVTMNSDLKNILSVMKRPILSSRDYENIIDDDYMPHQLLYDYSTWDAWMNHPVKRFKPNETSQNKNRHVRDLYAAERNQQPDFPTTLTTNAAIAENNIKTEPMATDELDTTLNHEVKKEPVDDDGKTSTDLFTVVGLQPSYKDLDQLFEEDNSGSSPLAIQVNTPPGSNKSTTGVEDTKKMFLSNSAHTGIFRPEELSKMFPTPPSLEHHPNSSPCGAGLSEHQLDLLDSPNLGSPIDEQIEDWSYVFLPPTISKFVGSSKYAPLTNLPSQSQPMVTLPPNIVYKPSWQQQHNIAASNNNNNKSTNNNNNANVNNNISEKIQQSPHSVQLQQPPQSSHQLINLPPSGGMLTPNSLSRPSSVTPIPIPNMNMNFVGPPGMNLNPMQHAAMRSDMSPISPATAAGHSYGPNIGGSPMQYSRRGLLPPPPPYEVAVASPATSTSSYLNKQFNSHEPPTPTVSRVPEANALLLNVLLYDTALNVFKDHNFDSCTLCVCNAGHKCVGNIRGSDSGVYLALPGHTLDPSSLYNNTNNCGYGGYGGIDSPAGIMATNHNVGYLDEDPVKCSCGFSAVVNRRLAHRSGLFYEDEMEITGMAEDPSNYKRNSQLAHLLGVIVKSENAPNDRDSIETLSHAMMDLLQDQCALIQSSSNSIQRAIRCFRSLNTSGSVTNALINMLEYTDAQDIICLALDQSRMVFESQFQNRLEMTKPFKYGVSVHKWPYVKASGPRSNRDIVRVMKSMRPLLQDAFHKKCTTRLWDAPYTVQGPLTWRQFHRMASSSSGQCEPQPIPSVVVGHEKDWLSVSPYAIQYWDKLMLEPYSYARDVAYVIIAPDNDFVVGRAKSFFKELSTTYEMCKLGRHNPIKGWDGVLRVNSKSGRNEGLDEWFSSLGESRVSELLKMYAQTCQQQLVPYLSKIPSDKSLLDPPEGMNTSSSSNKDRSLPSPMRPPSTPDSSQTSEKAPSTPKSSDVDMEAQRESLNNSATPPSTVEPLGISKDEVNPPCIVIYVIDPFSIGYDSQDVQRLGCLALLRCYSNILNSIPESVRSNINFQVISMESVMELGRNRDRLRASDEMRCLALSVFSQCRRHLTHSASVKSLTGFGTAANMELFLKNKDEKNRAAYKLYTPPYILSGRHEKSENTETFGTTSIEQQSSVMYCSYCLSEDQRWLLAVATDDRGELLETVTINIDIPNRRRRKKASARRLGLQKLMDFIIGVISQSGQPWRIVVGRIGRIGHGELKGWSWLLSKQNLLKASKQLKDICEQCSLMHPHTVPSILSACLVTLEPDSNLRVMPDQFTPDERFSQISMQSPLSTPQDVTCTHILVFPTSAKAQSSQSAFHEQHINGFGLDEEELFDLGDGDDGMDDVNMNGFDDIFGQDFDNEIQMPQASPERSRVGSPEDNGSRQSPSRSGANGGGGRNTHSQQEEEVGQVLQQPLALGYMVSTAPTGRMPTWFWSSCPHLENVCPVFLKTALHLHSPSIQQNTDDILHQNQSSATDHPLDSTFTADVLRYVLEGYNVLSWLAMDSNTHDRLSCLPIHVQVLMQLYHMTAVMA